MPNAVTNQSVRSIVIPLFFLFVITLLFITISPLVHSPVSPYNLNQRLGSIPLFFEENLGQLGKEAKFSTRGKGYTACFSESGVKFFINTVKENSHSSFEMRLVDATETQFISPQNSLPGKSHFYTGRNQDSWHVNDPHYSKLKYSQVYPGIDLVFYGNRNRLEFDFVVQPGVSPDMVAFEFNGVESVDIGQNGDLLVKVGNEAFTFHRPKIYQECYGEKRPVEGCYSETENGSIGFIVESYDPQFALVIDPTLTYSTYVGGNELDQTKGIAKDDEGNIYIAGFSRSSILPQDNPNPPTSTSDLYGFVLKFDPAGTNLLYAVYLDGQDIEACLDLAVDGEGNAFVTGYTKSSDFPVQNAWQDKLIGPRDAFIAKLGPDGSELLFSTFLGGAGGWDHDYRLLEWRGNDQGNAIAIDESGNAYIAGETDAIDFPVTETAWDTSGGVIELTYTSTSYHDGFAARFSPEGGLIYSTFIGGDEEEDMEWRETASDDYCHGICVDVNGYAYITGRTESDHFPTTENAVQKSNAGWSDVFVVKLNPDGSDAVYSTYGTKTHLSGRASFSYQT
jgi:hypothetical protein